MSALVAVGSQETELKQTLPHNLEAEQALLSALLHNNRVYERVSEFLRPEHFAHAAHGKIYATLARLIERGQVADPITLKDGLEQSQELEDVGGTAYLAKLATAAGSSYTVVDYGQIIYDLYLRRQLIDLGQNIISGAYTSRFETEAIKQIELAEQKLYDLASSGHLEREFIDFTKALVESISMAEIAFKRDSHIVGITSGLRDLDRWLGGLHPSDLIILAGRPSMGKTALATNIAFNAAEASLREKREGGIVAFFSLEMSAEQLATRLLAQESGISSDKIRRGELSQADFPVFKDVLQRLQGMPLYIDDTPALSISALRTRARRLKRKHGLDLIIIDYLQLLQGPTDGNKRIDGRVQEISEITRGLKALAKELNVPVLALSQLSRAVEQRDDKRPQLADLRESGSIEQDADVVMFVYREEYYEGRREPPPDTDKHREWQTRMEQIHNLAEVILAKQRHGPIGTIRLFFDGRLTKFGDLADTERLPTGG